MSLSRQRFKVPRIAHILQLLDVGIVDLETELVKFLLHALDDLSLEETAVVKEFLRKSVSMDAKGTDLDRRNAPP